MMSLYVASHYKNSPNDLILMSGERFNPGSSSGLDWPADNRPSAGLLAPAPHTAPPSTPLPPRPADAPAHRLFVLLGPVDETQNALPDVLAVAQVSTGGGGGGQGGGIVCVRACVLACMGWCGWVGGWGRPRGLGAGNACVEARGAAIALAAAPRADRRRPRPNG